MRHWPISGPLSFEMTRTLGVINILMKVILSSLNKLELLICA